MDRIAVLPDIRSFRKPDYQPDIRWVPDTGYFRHMMNYTKILKSQIFKNEKKVFINIRFAGYPVSGRIPDS